MKRLCMTLGLLAAASFAFAQEQQEPVPQSTQSSQGGWRRVDEPPPANSQGPNAEPYSYDTQAGPEAAPDDQQQPNGPDNYPPPGNYPPRAGNYPQSRYPDSPRGNYPQPNVQVPPQLTVRAGTYVTVRINQGLSSNRNQVGDAFSGVLVQPLVVDGFVVAERGQVIGGRVSDAERSGHDQVSHLGLELTDISLVDGQTLPVESRLIRNTGPAPVGRDAGAIVGTTAAGAAIGGIAGGGVGAGIGALVGVAAGTIGVLATRGRETIVYPESVLTFRLEQAVTVATDRSPQAFRYMDPQEYRYNDRPAYARMAPPAARYPAPPPPYYYGPGYYPYSYPFGFSMFLGPRYYYGGGMIVGRGWRR